jgi:formate hydrogenlyase transcriptional activator
MSALEALSARQSLMLSAWEAVSTERHLHGVLDAVANVLVPVVPFDSIGIVALHGSTHDLYALHVVGVPYREGETLQQFIERTSASTRYQGPPKPVRPLDGVAMRRDAEAGVPYACADLLAKDAWYEHEFHLAAGGVRAYAAVSLLVRGGLVGSAVFTRAHPLAFSPEQITTLQDVAPALAVAVSNALSNEEIRRLRDQLEAENIALRTQLGQAPWFEDVVGDSPALRRVLEAVEQVAPTDATVLITGETGTGKELIARAIHRRSPRAHGPLVKVNCAAIPETLLASELFGHERGAFTGAAERRKGRFEQAHGGTLFLDEIGEMPPETQVLLLRVLQEREFERLGGSQTVRVDVRVVVATNRHLEERVQAGAFRSDLFYRLNVFPLHVPPLRERPDDIAPLAAHFAARYGERFNRAISRMEARTLEVLKAYPWPGNVRELENVVERAVILSRNGILRVQPSMLAGAQVEGNMPEHLRGKEREAIEAALRAARGRIAGADGAARRLGLPASTLEFRIKRLGIDKFRHRREG